tara:strand:+ start:155 stop:292 length:138 start_codon:yes stop_codon:yes gene_type:complete
LDVFDFTLKLNKISGANPKVTQFVHKNITQPKEWVDIDGGHFGRL